MPFWYECKCVLLSAMKGQGLIKSREGGVMAIEDRGRVVRRGRLCMLENNGPSHAKI